MLLENFIITVYCLVDETLKNLLGTKNSVMEDFNLGCQKDLGNMDDFSI